MSKLLALDKSLEHSITISRKIKIWPYLTQNNSKSQIDLKFKVATLDVKNHDFEGAVKLTQVDENAKFENEEWGLT